MYIAPTDDMVEEGMQFGWSEEQCRRGYDIFDWNGYGLLIVEMLADVYVGSPLQDYVTDDDCVAEAERSGFCKIIPVDELPEHMIEDGSDRRWYGWVDTPDNRKRINEFFAVQNL